MNRGVIIPQRGKKNNFSASQRIINSDYGFMELIIYDSYKRER